MCGGGEGGGEGGLVYICVIYKHGDLKTRGARQFWEMMVNTG